MVRFKRTYRERNLMCRVGVQSNKDGPSETGRLSDDRFRSTVEPQSMYQRSEKVMFS